MKAKDAKIFADNIVQELFPGVDFSFGDSTYHKLKQFDDPDIFREKVLQHIEQIKSLTNRELYWYSKGFRGEDIQRNIVDRPKECKICKKFYLRKETGNSKTCSDECNTISRQIGNKRLSESRKNYNSRDPVQYAERHDVSLEEAQKQIDYFVRCGSVLCIEYYTSRGMSEEDAIAAVSKKQSENSKRCVDYWMRHGRTLEEATESVRQYQSAEGLKHVAKNYDKIKNGEYSNLCVAYWINKGYSEEESRDIISEIQRKYSLRYVETVPLEERKKNSHVCIEYWEKRYPDDYMERYADHITNTLHLRYVSEISREVFSNVMTGLTEDYIDANINTNTNEYVVVSRKTKKCYLYDFVDKKQKICIEFNGDYWHANPAKYSSDDIISFPKGRKEVAKNLWEADALKLSTIESERAYRTIVVWESDYKNDPVGVVSFLRKELGYESC